MNQPARRPRSRWSGVPARALGLALTLSGAAGATAQEERALSLDEALAVAEAGNPELLAATERSDAQLQRAQGVLKTRWPRLVLTSGWARTDNPSYVFAHKLTAGEFTAQDFAIDSLNSPTPISHLQTSLGLELPVDVFGRISAQAEAQHGVARTASAGRREARQELRLRVTEAYRRAELARRSVEVSEQALRGARAREADIEARVEEGAALSADLLRARARRRQREAERAERVAEAATAEAGLARLLGVPPTTRLRPTDAPATTPSPLAGDEADWAGRALAQRPLLEAARAREEAAQAAGRAEDRTRLPELSVHASVQDDRNRVDAGGQSFLVGAFLRLAPFDAARGKRRAAAQAEARAATLDVRGAADQLRFEVAAAWRRASAARERLTAARGGTEDGQEALRVMRERREAGLATLTDELETEAQSLAAELEEMRAAAEVALADAALRRAAGEI